MKLKLSETTPIQINWLVAEALNPGDGARILANEIDFIQYHEDWAHGGPIIEWEKIELKYLGYDNPPYWGALKFSPSKYERRAATGPTPLIAAMRCYVASKLGDEVEIPEELK